jgi:hypothetical protein
VCVRAQFDVKHTKKVHMQYSEYHPHYPPLLHATCVYVLCVYVCSCGVVVLVYVSAVASQRPRPCIIYGRAT